MKYIGGYSILDLNDTPNVSKQANICYSQDKPVLVYDENGNKFFADTISKIGTNIIITKGGKTITINDLNVITSIGEIQEHLYEHRITINGDDTDTNTYFMRIFIYNNNATQLTLNDLIKVKFNGVMVDNDNLTQAIEELDKVTIGDKEGIVLYSVFNNEQLSNQFLIEDLTFEDVVTKLF